MTTTDSPNNASVSASQSDPSGAEQIHIAGGHLDRRRAQSLLADAGADALLLLTRQSVKYATGGDAGPVTLFERAGSAFVVIPADAGDPPSAIIGDFGATTFASRTGIADVRPFPTWIETSDITGFVGQDLSLRRKLALADRPPGKQRPATFEPERTFALLNDVLADRGLGSAAIAIETDGLTAEEGEAIKRACPNVRWLDGGPLLARLRMIKSAAEIAILARAAASAEAGMRQAQSSIATGLSGSALADIWRDAALDHAATICPGMPLDTWSSVASGPDAFSGNRPVQRGDTIKFDVGVVVDGYSSDSARTFACGQPPGEVSDLFKTMLEAHAAAVDAVAVGNPLGEIHRAAMTVMHRAGFDSYHRGHFGHGLGASSFVEQWPFIGPGETEPVAPGMVLAVEVPWYIQGLGAFMIEDQFVIGERGPERAWMLPRELVVV
ncbi:MAG: Xaa-Pro peptidase family protein [Pseudomonadota bacterium]